MDLPGCLTAGDFLGQETSPAGREAQPALPSMADRAEGFTSALRAISLLCVQAPGSWRGSSM